MKRLFLLLLLLPLTACGQRERLLTGADQLDVLLPKLTGKRVGLMVNHTALLGKRHLADTLKALGVNLVKIYGPEHGFRGTADAGEEIKDGIDARTGVPVVSLYGKNYKATPEQVADVDIIVFDIQDVGVRFFTYISSLHYLMETCAENGKKLIVLDRPNPNGGYVDGPVRTPEQKSFVGMHPIPIAHGMTIGEYARMINGEGWLADRRTCDLEVIPMKGWRHGARLPIPVKPSPNLPNDHAIGMYPSTCLFEGTVLSIGRGTPNPFEVTGHPDLKGQPYAFTPVAIEGMDKNPKLKDTECFGLDMRNEPLTEGVTLKYLIRMYEAFPDKEKFFISYFDKLAGNTKLKEQIRAGMSEAQIKETWKPELDAFKVIRSKYVLYP